MLCFNKLCRLIKLPNLFPVLTVIKIIPDTSVVKCD
nr:MAG TPA: hypothetical protein [Caudoviricetes sp.]